MRRLRLLFFDANPQIGLSAFTSLSELPHLEVVAITSTVINARRQYRRHAPDVVVLGLDVLANPAFSPSDVLGGGRSPILVAKVVGQDVHLTSIAAAGDGDEFHSKTEFGGSMHALVSSLLRE